MIIETKVHNEVHLVGGVAYLLRMNVIPQFYFVILLHELEWTNGQVTDQEVWHQCYYLSQVELTRSSS